MSGLIEKGIACAFGACLAFAVVRMDGSESQSLETRFSFPSAANASMPALVEDNAIAENKDSFATLAPVGSSGASILMEAPAALSTASPSVEKVSTKDGETDERSDAIRGLVRPRHQAVFSSQIEGRVVKIPFEPGDRFRKGDVLIQFDCALLAAEHEAAKAERDAKRMMHTNRVELRQLDAMADIDVELSAAELAQAMAKFEIASVYVDRCALRAPFRGVVLDHSVNPYESVSANQPLLSVLDDGELEIEVIVPSAWLVWVEPKQRFSFRIDETGQNLEAEVLRIGAAADPVSQTVRLTAGFRGGADRVLSGMSGTASFSRIAMHGNAINP